MASIFSADADAVVSEADAVADVGVAADEEAGIVTRVIDGRTHRLSLRPEALAETSDWIERQRARWEQFFDVVGEYLEETKE